MCSSTGVHKIFMSWYGSKKVSAFSTDVHRAEGSCVLRQEVAAAVITRTLRAFGLWTLRSGGVVPERCNTTVLQPSSSLLNIIASLHSAATPVAQQTVTFHFLQPVKMEAGKMPKHLFVCSLQKKSLLFLYVSLIQNSRQTPFSPWSQTGLCA